MMSKFVNENQKKADFAYLENNGFVTPDGVSRFEGAPIKSFSKFALIVYARHAKSTGVLREWILKLVGKEELKGYPVGVLRHCMSPLRLDFRKRFPPYGWVL
jgi:hypothetical protein